MIFGNTTYESMVQVRNSRFLPIWEQLGVFTDLKQMQYPDVETTKRELRHMVKLAEELTPERYAYCQRVDRHLYTVMHELLAAHGINEPVATIKSRVQEYEPVIDYLKMHYNRPRPFQTAGVYNIPLYPRLSSGMANSASYPSGHTLLALFFRHIYMMEHPELAEPLMKFVLDVKKTREEGGVHYPSDSVFSIKIYKHIKEYL